MYYIRGDTMEKIKEKILEMIGLYDSLKYKTDKTEQEEHLYYIIYKMLEGLEDFTEMYTNYRVNNQLEKDLKNEAMDNQIQDFLKFKLSSTIPSAVLPASKGVNVHNTSEPTKPVSRENMDWMAFGTAAAMTGLFNPIAGSNIEHQQISDFHSMMKDVKFEDHDE